MNCLEGKHIVLGISGGIAAYKTVTLLRLLKKAKAEVQVVMTPAAREFITPVTLSSLSGNPVVSEFFTANTGEWHSHVDLGLWADLMVIAPATASTIGKMANGIADNMLITTYLSAKERVMIAPAMDLDMFAHPTTGRNLKTLKDDGVIVLNAAEGELASGLSGKGRMLEPEQIFLEIEKFFNGSGSHSKNSLDGKRVLITAGPTYEKIDPVRFIGNHSSGKMGFALANECMLRGADVTVIAGPVSSSLKLDNKIRRYDVTTAEEMYEAAKKCYKDSDIAIFSAAVADYRPEITFDKKIKRENREELTITLCKNRDIALELGNIKTKQQFNIGFALETENGIENAKDKLKRKKFDMIVLNSAGKPGEGFNSDTNRITIIDNDDKVKVYGFKTKAECASDIIDALCEKLKIEKD